MEIRALELENVKSYERETVSFARGTNAICGPNGAGKSTILEAIGFALFDVAPCRPISNFVREGEKAATVTVTVAANDEREYQVVRRCGTRNQYYVYDPELDARLVVGTDDVLAWLKDQFGVEETAKLETLFRDAVGVPQGTLTAAFLLTPEKRKATFDPLLRVEEYNEAFGRLLETKRALDAQVRELELQIAGLQAEVRELPRLQGEAEDLTAGLDRAQAELEALAPQLAALEAKRRELEGHRDHLRELQERAARLDERVSALQRQLQQAGQALEQAQRAAATLAENEAGHRAYLAAQERRHALEAQEQARARAQQAVSETRARHQVSEERVRHLERDLENARAAAAEADSLQPAAEEQERLQRELVEAELEAQRWQEATRRLEQERRRLDQLEGRRQQLDADLAERDRLEREGQEAEHKLEALDETLRSVQGREGKESARLEQLQAQQETLAGIDGAQCPVCESELTAERRAELQERNRRQVQRQAEVLADLKRKADEVSAQRRTTSRALTALRQALAKLPRLAERETAQADCTRQQATVEQVEAEVRRLADANAQAKSLAARLAELGDPQAAYQRALAVAEQGVKLEAELDAGRVESAELAARLTSLEHELAAFARLDADLEAVRADLQASEAAHRLYLQHEREAAELGARQARRQELEAEHSGAEGERQALAKELEAAQAAFRPEEYERVAAAYLQANEARGRLETQVQMQQAQLDEAQARIAELQATAGRLQAAEEELADQRDAGHLLDYLRRILKEAGPQVTRALVEVISQQAARLYADITNDQIGRLRWAEDYEVLVDHSGYARAFQQLSGGEQMAAALAVRLALLREVSGIDVVFFDEPTSNLDDTRRDNLADQILGIKYFAQLFVVSHDDTFERATDHTVRLAKLDGRSKVVP